MAEELAALVVGCGRIAGSVGGEPSHADAYRRQGGFRMTACVDPDTARRQSFMARWNIGRGYSTLEDAIAGGGAWDVASVCTPTGQHAADLRVLLDTPVRAVWCEKPITVSSRESATLVDAYARAGKLLAVNHLRRWHPAMSRLRLQIAEGRWGAVRAAAGFYTRGVRNNGSHLVDLIQFLLGPVQPVSAVRSRIDYQPDDPTVDALLRTETGIPVHLISSDARDFALFELEIVTAAGSIRIERSGRTIRTRGVTDDPDAQGYRILDEGTFEHVGTGDTFVRAADNIYRSVREGAALASDGASALAAEKSVTL